MALVLSPSRAETRFHLAETLLQTGDPQTAIAHYKGILGTNPRLFAAANSLARVLSTHPDESVRSPQEALMLAQRLCQITKNRNADFLVTMALAQANSGQFDEAARLLTDLQKALPPDSPLAKEIAPALESVTKQQAVRNSSWK